MWLSRRGARIPAFWMATYRSRGRTRHARGLWRCDKDRRGQKTPWGVVTAVPSAFDGSQLPCHDNGDSSRTRAIRGLRRASGQIGRLPLAVWTLGVVVFFVCGAESGWRSERLKAVEQSMQQYSQRQFLIPRSEFKEHQESQMHRVHALPIQC